MLDLKVYGREIMNNINTDRVPRIKRSWYFPIILLFMVPLAGMGIDIYAPSLPAITEAFHTSMHLTKLTMALYIFGYGVGPLLFGTLSDTHGRKKILVIGIILYIISCLLIIILTNIWFMLSMRFVQGFMIGAVGAIVKAMMSDAYEPGEEMRKMASMIVTAWAIGPIIAPFIGGYLQHYFGWQANFVFLIIYAAIILTALLFIPETNMQRAPLQWSIVLGNYCTIITHPVFLMGAIFMGVVYSLIAIFNVVGPFLIQTILHYSAVQFGHIAFVMGFAFSLGGILNRFLIQKLNPHFLVITSLCIMAATSIIMLLLGKFFVPELYRYVIPIFLVLFFSSTIFPAGMTKAMSLFPQVAGSASALLGFLFTIFTGIITVVASFLNSSNQIDSAIAYLVLIGICFVSYLLLDK